MDTQVPIFQTFNFASIIKRALEQRDLRQRTLYKQLHCSFELGPVLYGKMYI